jgi:OOP family OmpA-OmpF porin
MTQAQAQLTRAPLKLTIFALAMMANPYAMAQETGWYAGGNIGQTKATIDNAQITSKLVGAGLGVSTLTNQDTGHGNKVFGGYQFGRNFALEGGYFDLGQFGFAATTTPPGALQGDIRLRGVNLDAVGILPITEKLSVFARVGANYAEARDSFMGTGAVNVLNPTPSKMETNPKIGLGLQYRLTESLALRAEIERYRINDAVGTRGDVDIASVSLVYYFDVKSPEPVAIVAEPAPVAVAQAPAPLYIYVQPVPPPPPPVVLLTPLPMPMKRSYSADSFFGFDKSSVNPDGQKDLSRLAQDLLGLDYAVVRVTGHTDRFGSHDYNMKLSNRRAQEVQRYLVETAGVPANKIEAKGVNGSDPLTRPGDCIGTKATKAVIACLQPDRRVDIEVSGTR